MIPIVEINYFSNVFQVAAETIEKDYIISWILLCLSKSNLKNNFIFYGGTAIKRIYFEEHRFSEDIDLLSTQRFSLEYILQELNCLNYAREKANLTLTIDPDIIRLKDRIQIYVKYFGYDEIIGAPKEIRLDFSMDMEKTGKVIQREMIESYSDLKNQKINISVMSLNSILANKLGLLFDLTRNEPRDLFDIWFLLRRLDSFDYNLEQVREAFKERFSFYPTSVALLRRLKNPKLKNDWNSRLNKQVAELPDIDKVMEEVEVKLKEMLS